MKIRHLEERVSETRYISNPALVRGYYDYR